MNNNEILDMNIDSSMFEFASNSDYTKDKKLETKPVGFFQDALYRFARNKASVSAFVIICLLILFAIFAPIFGATEYSNTKNDNIYLRYQKLLPKLDFTKKGIPEDSRTMVVIPTIVGNEAKIKEMFDVLETFYIINKSDNLYFTLLGDIKGAKEEVMPFDENIFKYGVEYAEKLNKKYGKDLFYFIYRKRHWNEKEDQFLGYERKRGALVQFNQILLGKMDDKTNKKYFNVNMLHNKKLGVKYVITLDTDTRLVLNTALNLVGCMAHPFNRPVIDKKTNKVVSGYGIMQPRVGVDIEATNKSLYSQIFAGIGGFRMAMQNLGGKCVFSSEWDAQAQKTYLLNYGEIPFGDITKESVKSYIPDNFDILCAGFPCQAFSMAGKRLGFEETRGTLFFDVAEILRRKRPKAFFLENVKGLLIHDKGRTIQTILKVLREDLNYYVPDPQVVNAMNFGVPQHRERVYIVGFRKDQNVNEFTYPTPTDTTKTFADVKEEKVVSAKYYLSTQYIKTLVAHKERHAAKGNGFGYDVIHDDEVANAIVVGGMGRERNLVLDHRLTDFTPVTRIKGEVNREGLRRMTPREWARLQGYPDNFIIEVADASAYKQFGNSVAVPAIQATANEIIKRINLTKIKDYDA